MGVSLNKSLLRRICAYLNARFSGILDDGLRFRPGQLLKDGGHVAVFPEGFCDRVDFVDGGIRESFLFTLMMRTVGDRSESRYRVCEILDYIVANLKEAEDFTPGDEYDFLYFDVRTWFRLVSRWINGDEVYAVKMLARYDRKGAW